MDEDADPGACPDCGADVDAGEDVSACRGDGDVRRVPGVRLDGGRR